MRKVHGGLTVKNQSIDQNIALKCNWNDAGYIDVCSNEAYHHNVKVRKASWCSHADCECRYWDYVDADNYPCWESKLFIDFSNNETLKSKSAFSESFLARELCENNFFGTAVKDAEKISDTNTITINKANSEAKMVCIIFK